MARVILQDLLNNLYNVKQHEGLTAAIKFRDGQQLVHRDVLVGRSLVFKRMSDAVSFRTGGGGGGDDGFGGFGGGGDGFGGRADGADGGVILFPVKVGGSETWSSVVDFLYTGVVRCKRRVLGEMAAVGSKYLIRWGVLHGKIN